MPKRKKAWRTKEERDAWDAYVDETVRTRSELVRNGREELKAKPAAAEPR